MITELLSASAALFFILILILFLLPLAMRIYITLRKSVLDRKAEALLQEYRRQGWLTRQPSYSAPIPTVEVEVPQGDLVLELDLTKKA